MAAKVLSIAPDARRTRAHVKLLNIDANAKTVKGRKRGYMTAVLYLLQGNRSGHNICAMHEVAECLGPCLGEAGRGGIAAGRQTFTAPNGEQIPDNAIQRARLERTLFFIYEQAQFMGQLVREIRAFIARAKRLGLIPVIRLNGTSDIRWEDIPVEGKANIFALFPRVMFYDYTKIPNRRHALAVKNYRLTFSYSHAPAFAPIVARAVSTYGAGVNYAAVFAGKTLPAHFLGRDVINGDESDLRFLDRPGVVVGLIAKGKARRNPGTFVVPRQVVAA
jgi:hypothetical protein